MKNKIKNLAIVAIAIASFVSSLASAQALTETNYNSQYFSTIAGYNRSFGIISTSQPAALRWQGNDPYNPITQLGETDLVARVTGYTPSPIFRSSVIQGGLGIGDNVFPGTNNVQIWKTFSPSTSLATPTVTYFNEWSLIPSLEDAPYNLNDTFSFDLRNAANTQSLLKLQLTPNIAIQSNSYTLQTIASGVGTSTLADLAYQALFQIQVDITGSSYNMQISQINSTNRAVITNITLVTGASLSSGMTASDLATIGIGWNLTSGNAAEPGSNYLIANQFQVTTSGTPIPEPGTWASAGLLLLAAGYTLRRRSLARPS